jgi:hypothetical protein
VTSATAARLNREQSLPVRHGRFSPHEEYTPRAAPVWSRFERNIMKVFILDRYKSKDGVRFGETRDPEVRRHRQGGLAHR